LLISARQTNTYPDRNKTRPRSRRSGKQDADERDGAQQVTHFQAWKSSRLAG
jgi:hypothetical protein